MGEGRQLSSAPLAAAVLPAAKQFGSTAAAAGGGKPGY